MHPFTESLIILSIDAEIVIGCLELMRNGKENGVIHRINVRDDGPEFITMFKDGQPDINIHEDVCRQ